GNPSARAESTLGNLPRAAAQATCGEQLDAEAVGDAEESGRCQEWRRPVAMRRKQTKQSRTLGELGKQATQIAIGPAIKRPFRFSFEYEQNSQRDRKSTRLNSSH